MSSLIPIFFIALVGTILGVFLKESKMPVLGVLVALVAGIIIFIRLLPGISQVIEVFNQLASQGNLNSVYLKLIMKIIAISYVAEFMGQICKDAGQNGLGLKIDMAAKVTIMIAAVPVLVTILDSILKIMP